MSDTERDRFLTDEHICRLATIGPHGPHVSPLWFVWDGAAMWFYSIVRSQRWVNLERDPRIAVIVDAGTAYAELRGVELTGAVERVGEVPRAGETHSELVEPERLFAAKYVGADTIRYDLRHAWLRLVPRKIVSWDFRKLQA